MSSGTHETVVIAGRSGALPIVTPFLDDPLVQLAADELMAHVVEVTGHRPGLAPDPHDGQAVQLVLEQSARLGTDGYQLDVGRHGATVTASQGSGLLYGTYELLEQCGVRWLMPGPDGTVLPADELRLPHGRTIGRPHFTHRMLQHLVPYPGSLDAPGIDRHEAEDWCRRHRLDTVQYGRHGMPLWPPASPETDPELYVTVDGRQSPQLDVTSPAVLDRVEAGVRRLLVEEPGLDVVSLGPEEDHGPEDAFGVTDWDVDGRRDPLTGALVVTDRYVRFYNALLRRLADHPRLRLAFYAHGRCLEAPVRERPDPRLIPVLAPVTVESGSSITDSDGWERRYVLRIAEDWRALGVEWMYRGYLGIPLDPGVFHSAAEQIAVELPELVDRGAGDGIRLECCGGWGHQGPAFFLAAKLMWDPSLDPGAVLDDYFRAGYGPAASTVQHYFSLLHRLAEAVPYNSGRTADLAASVPLSRLADLERALAHAEALLSQPAWKAHRNRLAVLRRAHDLALAVLDCQQHHVRGAYAEAASALHRVRLGRRAALAVPPLAVHPAGGRHLERQLGSGIDVVAATVTRCGPPLAVTPRIWQAHIDDSGATARPDVSDGNWTSLDAWRSWAAQGLRYVTGAAWYRCALPGRPPGGRPELVLPTLAVPCRAWLNGRPLRRLGGRDAGGPVRFDLTTAWSAREPNDLLLQLVSVPRAVAATGILGTGLVFADPASPWSPRDVRPIVLRETPSPAALPTTATGAVSQNAVVPTGDWRVLLDPLGTAERFELHDIRTTISRFRPYDPSLPATEQGLGRYGGGYVLRAELTVPDDAGAMIITAVPGTRVWWDGELAEVSETAGGRLRVARPPGVTATTTVVIVVPRPAAGPTPTLSPSWSRD